MLKRWMPYDINNSIARAKQARRDPFVVDKTAIVLDLDETLVHTKTTSNEFPSFSDDPRYIELRRRLYLIYFPNETGKLDKMWGIKRPYVDDLVRYCFDNFDYVIIWSAGTKEYVDKITRILFEDAGHASPHFIFSREDCVLTEDNDLIKPLRWLHVLEPELQKNVPLKNMIILDNKESNFMYDIENALLIEDYAPSGTWESIHAQDDYLANAMVQIDARVRKMNFPN